MYKTIGILGDLHCGSRVGLHHERGINPAIDYLIECHAHLLKVWPVQIDLLLFMGDLIDGPQSKARATGLVTPHLGEQVDIAIEVARPWLKRARRIMRVDGTPYHEEFHGAITKFDLAMGIAKADTGQVLDVDFGGEITANIAHHPIGGATLYAGTQVDKEALWSQIAAYNKHVHDCNWIIRAHRHFYIMQEQRMRTVLQSPCWQLPTPYAKKQNYWRFQPDIGGLLLVADADAMHGYRVIPTLYETQKQEVIRHAKEDCQAEPAKRRKRK